MISKNLLRLLKEKNLSVSEISKRTAVPKSTIFSWTTGSCPNLFQLDQVAQYLGTSIDFLAFDRENNTKEKSKNEIAGEYKITIEKLR